jgi:hypothetical protein
MSGQVLTSAWTRSCLGSRIEKGAVPTVLHPRRLVREKNDGEGWIPSGLLAELADREELIEVLAVLGLIQDRLGLDELVQG